MNLITANNPQLMWQGRTYEDHSGFRHLVGSVSSLKFRYSGDHCRIWIQNLAPPGGYCYITLIVDGVRQPRIAIHKDTFSPLEITPPKESEFHDLELYKETEAVNGHIVISSVEAEAIGLFPLSKRKKIEFIGNSITVGMGSDPALMPCESGIPADHQNAFDAYGPRTARALEMDYIITGVSGMGMYRNWNTDYPVMEDVFESVVMSPDPTSPRWNFNEFIPDIVSICLGTNDLSDGDGVNPRLPFDGNLFIQKYIDFLGILHQYYPEAEIVLTNTPVTKENKNEQLMSCLGTIKSKAGTDIPGMKPIRIFSFSLFYGSGCSGHPSVGQHGEMAKEMVGFFRDTFE
jgi:GDSL-like Lipase/Acylhydrolase family/Carbohydrate esterase 2 N-terminal